MKIEPGALVRLGQEAVLGADQTQWVLYKLKRGDIVPLDAPIQPQKLRPQREIREEGLILTAQGAE